MHSETEWGLVPHSAFLDYLPRPYQLPCPPTASASCHCTPGAQLQFPLGPGCFQTLVGHRHRGVRCGPARAIMTLCDRQLRAGAMAKAHDSPLTPLLLLAPSQPCTVFSCASEQPMCSWAWLRLGLTALRSGCGLCSGCGPFLSCCLACRLLQGYCAGHRLLLSECARLAECHSIGREIAPCAVVTGDNPSLKTDLMRGSARESLGTLLSAAGSWGRFR